MISSDLANQMGALCEGLLDALGAFDGAHPPLGLYASDELVSPPPRHHTYQEWHQGLKPWLRSLGATRIDTRFNPHGTDLFIPGLGFVELSLTTISKVKVRKYGSHYRVDKHEAYEGRWLEREMEGQLFRLRERTAFRRGLRVLVFLGYDRKREPFGQELARLAAATHWDRHGTLYRTRSWVDRYGRGFGIRLCAWAVLPESQEGAE